MLHYLRTGHWSCAERSMSCPTVTLMQITNTILQEIDAHGAKTTSCPAAGPVDVADNPVKTHVHRVESEQTSVLFVVVEAFVVGGVHLHL